MNIPIQNTLGVAHHNFKSTLRQWRAEGVRTVRRPRASTLGGIQGASFL